MNVFSGVTGAALVVTLTRGEDLHDGILSACRVHGMRDAAIVSAVATLSPVVLHEVTTEGFPIGEYVRTLPGPWELAALSGLVVDGEVHAHLVVSNAETTTGGHLHAGTIVLYLAEVVLLGVQLTGAPLSRHHEAGTDLWMIHEERDGSSGFSSPTLSGVLPQPPDRGDNHG